MISDLAELSVCGQCCASNLAELPVCCMACMLYVEERASELAEFLTRPGIGTRIIHRYLCTNKYIHISMYCVG